MEVDYTEKLNFSDDEENQASKDKRDWWVDAAFLLHRCYIWFMVLFLTQDVAHVFFITINIIKCPNRPALLF